MSERRDAPREGRRRTLRGRVAQFGIAVIAGWLAVLTVGFNLVLDRELHSQADDVLRARADSAAATVLVGAAGKITVIDTSTDAAVDSGIWIYSGRSAVQRPRGDRQLQPLADSLVDRGTRLANAPGARLYARPLQYRGRQVGTVVAALSTAPAERAQVTAALGSVALSLLLLAGAYPILRLAVRRALEPVDRMTRQAAEWSAHSPEERFRGGQRFAELDHLAATLDGVLDRLSAVLRHERQISAELSHELRTPLARILAEAELTSAVGSTDPAVRAIRDSALRMAGIIETLLTTARAELQTRTAACDVRELVDRLAGAYHTPLRVTGAATAGVEAAVVERMIVPILDNADRYARREVLVAVRHEGGVVWIDVTNDGPPIPAGQLSLIFEPGRRGDPDDGHEGTGLGLSLARRLARAAEGDVVAFTSANGATFRVTLPAG